MSDEPPPARSRSAKGTIVRVALTGLAAWYFTRIVKRIDWSQVGQALGDLALIEIAALLAVVAVRQVLNAAPLALFVPGLGLRRAMANDLSANLVATVAPPPGDIVLRIAMFRSWGIGVNEGIGGLTLNTLTYYVARFGAPLLGLLIALAVGRSQPSFVYTALVSGTISLTVVAGLAVSTRGEGPAARLAGAVARQLRRVVSRVDPDEWAGRATVFVATLSDMVRARSLPAGACQLGLVLSESLLLFASLRFAGVPAESAGGVSILIALLIRATR